MKIKQTIFSVVLTALVFVPFIGPVQASATTLNLSTLSGDRVQATITGNPSSTIQLSFWPAGAGAVTTIVFGTTNSSGQFTTSISSGGYGIPAGSPTYATINGVQSSMQLWPSYSSSLVLDKSTVQVAIGQSIIVNSSSAIILAANSLTTSIGTAVNGSQLTVTGIAEGVGTLSICGANVGCASLPVTVGSGGQTQVSFNPNNITISNGQSQNVTIFGSSHNGYTIKSNSNPSVVDASISGTSDIISLYGKPTNGSATIVVCSVEDNNNCASLYITSLGLASTLVSFSQNNLNLIPGLNQSVTVSGGPDSNYFISSNSNSGVASVNLSGTTLTVTGGGTTGSAVIQVCSTSVSGTCGNLTVNNNAQNTTPSATTLSFSQNVVSVFQGSSSNVTVSGGTGTGYIVSANSSPTIASASISNNSNIISVTGNLVGSDIISICSATVSTTCASIYVNVIDSSQQISFDKTSVSLTGTATSLVHIFGQTGTKNISSNTNASVVTASLNTDSSLLLLTPGTSNGSSVVTVCSTVNLNNCASITVSNGTPNTNGTTTTDTSAVTVNPTQQLQQIANDVSVLVASTTVDAQAAANSKTYFVTLVGNSNVSAANKNTLAIFISNGTSLTKVIGAGERAGVLASYKKAFGTLPTTVSDWSDLIKIAVGRWPSVSSATAISSANAEFRKVYHRNAVMTNPNDNAAVTIIAYGLRPTNRNTNSEAKAVKIFKAAYGHSPVSALAWDIVRAIAYSGAKS